MNVPDEQAKNMAKSLRAMADTLDPPTPSSPPAQPPTAAPVGATGSWRKTFEDGFDGTALDLTKWRTGRPADATGGHVGYAADQGEKTFYLGEQVSVKDGNLALTATNKPLTVVRDASRQGQLQGDTYYRPNDQGTWQYRSGTVTTGADLNGWTSAKASAMKDWTKKPPTLQVLYGWIEARIKLPKGKGLWPAFWMLPVDGSWSYEIDILEQVDSTGRRLAQHLHANNNAVDFTKYDGLGWDSGIDLTADFHVYAVNWTKDKLQWLVDGKVIQETSVNVPNVAMYLLLNLAVGGNWPGNPDASTQFPSSMLVDWVRVWSPA
ncbi:MAG TPA: glycoside hydrolase family 16 protein [Propionibacteriaceae bacterium]|nr:glycoside hydrolase family 16 protein [Propionibacteriaceae bacterium]